MADGLTWLWIAGLALRLIAGLLLLLVRLAPALLRLAWLAVVTAPAQGNPSSSVRIWGSYATNRVTPLGDNLVVPWQGLPQGGVVEFAEGLRAAIEAARTYIYIEDQTLNPAMLGEIYVQHRFLYPLLSAAAERGVKVILLTQGSAGANAPSSDATPYISTEIQNSIIDPLSRSQRSNVGVFYLHNTKVHSKLVMIDDEFVSIGSANAWDRSMEGDESELSVAILDPGGTRSLVADLRVKLWQEHHRLPDNQVTDTILRNLHIGLGLFDQSWGQAQPSQARNTAVRRMQPALPPIVDLTPPGWENWRRGDERTITNSIQARSQQNREDLTDAFARMGMDTRHPTNNFTLGRTDRADRATLDEGEAGRGTAGRRLGVARVSAPPRRQERVAHRTCPRTTRCQTTWSARRSNREVTVLLNRCTGRCTTLKVPSSA
ncbi:phospholipase D-like domain-containing protein [Kibdelosporangium philippinense]|uniref:phospholipase D-like domain-containing protein n=1 Tax=Kibdelosporangium philippinense TaxID=211113 RepID=UPI00360E8EA6